MILLQPNQEKISYYLETAKKYGMGMELMELAFPLNLDNPERISAMHEAYRGAPLVSCHGVFADLNYSGSDAYIYQSTVKRLRQCIETSLEFGIKKYVFHSCFHPILQPDDPLYKSWNKKAAKLFCGLAGEYGIEIYIENVLDKTPRILVELMEAAAHPDIHICFDVGHANLSYCTLAEWIEAIHPYLRYLHLSDNRGRYDDHLAMGAGTVDWQAFFGLLRQYQIQADYTLEVTGVEGVAASIDYLKIHFEKL